MASLAVRIGSLVARNPIFSASGTFGHGLEMEGFCPTSSVGGLVSKTVTLRPRAGNPLPRLCETEAGLINSIGLENKGLAHYLEHVVPELARAQCLVVVNVGGHADEEFAELVAALDERPEVDALELNLSCPNVDDGKLPLATDPKRAEAVVSGARKRTTKPLFAKLSPNVTRIGDMARAVEAGGADAVTAVNTLLGLALDWRTRRPGVATVQGGYSGPGIKPVALRCAWECAQAVSLPIIGAGGIQSADDVLQFMVAGCSAVQVGTSSFWNPARLGELAREVDALLTAEGIDDINDLVGSLRDGRTRAARPRPNTDEHAPAAAGRSGTR